ncbi:MAG: DUF5666 domain-containing protein [Desulfobulbaceae bacterium]|nr:DUF5666 domain-containing protein [Desulfobulbaceae bacterium]
MKKTLFLWAIIVLTLSSLHSTSIADEHDRSGEDRDDYDSKLYGVIEAIPDNGYEGTWIVNGRKVYVSSNTSIREKNGSPAKGVFVKVKGQQSGDTFTAYRIEVENREKYHSNLTHAKIYGTVKKMPIKGVIGTWQIDDREIQVTKDTRVKEKYGPASMGSYVEIEGNYSDKNFTAYEIEVKRINSRTTQKSYNNIFTGKIERMPQGKYDGLWMVSGHEVKVNNKTLIDETAGEASPGSEVRVRGIRSGNTVNAFEIKITSAL